MDMTGINSNRAVAVMIDTTGMSVDLGHRVVEIGAVELVNRNLTLRRFHSFLNPGRESEPEALALHELTTEFLEDKPQFSDIAGGFAEFLGDAVLVVQPYQWTIGFLDRELALANMPPTAMLGLGIQDVVELAKQRAPGRSVSLNALCTRYKISRPGSLHGCALDAWMLARAYLALTRRWSW